MVETISREEAAWLAGIIEGEGSLMITRHQLKNGPSYRSEISVGNTEPLMIKKISEIWFNLNCKFYYTIKKTKNKWFITIHTCGRNSTNKILNLIHPFLITKKDQADLLMEFNSKMSQGMYQRHGIEWYKALQLEYIDKMATIRAKYFNPQRLKRVASKPLELDDGIV